MLTPCLGREGIRTTLAGALAESRWVSVVGPPGCGKTLLARHVTSEGVEAVWVDARTARSTDVLLQTALSALSVETVPGDTLAGALSRAVDGSDLVLVLDGLDLDTTKAADALHDLLESTTKVRLLVTTLTSAGHPGERVVRLGPLPVPTPRQPLDGPALTLFLDRIGGAGGHPVDLDGDADHVRRLLRATGGLPLLIEQAAAQCALVGLSNATAAVSLVEAVDASYDLLSPAQRRVFRRLGLIDFPVGLPVLSHVVDESEQVTAGLVGALVRRSLVELQPDGRFDMLTPIRAEAAARAEDPDEEATSRGLLRWADSVAPQHDNFGAADAPWLGDLPAMRAAVLRACAQPESRAQGYSVANRIFSALYTSMRSRDAVEILEAVLQSGDGPAAIGAQVARRAGIAASENRGTYAGLWLLSRADEHASAADRPQEQLAKNASIRAEMHLDAGDLHSAEAEARRAIELDPHGSIVRQANRTLADVHVSQGRFGEAAAAAAAAMQGHEAIDETWIGLSARTLLARMALEHGRVAEAVAALRAVVADAADHAEDRVGLLAETLLRDIDPDYRPTEVQRDTLPWAVRLPVLAQDARDLLRSGDVRRAAGLAADVAALADSARLGRDAVEARLVLGRALLAGGDQDQAFTTFRAALEHAAGMPMPLRAADALDGLAWVAHERGVKEARALASTAAALRAPRLASPWGYAATFAVEPGRQAPEGWVVDDQLAPHVLDRVTAMLTGSPPPGGTVLDELTAAERQVADRVADGLTSRQIGEELFVSPRTVDAHLTHIYRKLGINSRAKLAALVVDAR